MAEGRPGRSGRIVPSAPAGRTSRSEAGLPVGPGPDPVAPARRRRLRFMTVAAGAWTTVLHLMTTMPLPHR
ncbi:hypothetical protein DI272_29430 [Streptomyces sp. Act143]|nr:hypothetical protein DI272_29430 [Streptomyces sp. Act143]